MSRLERRQYRSAAGGLTTPWKPSNASYHLYLECIRAALNSQRITLAMELTPAHNLLFAKIGLRV